MCARHGGCFFSLVFLFFFSPRKPLMQLGGGGGRRAFIQSGIALRRIASKCQGRLARHRLQGRKKKANSFSSNCKRGTSYRGCSASTGGKATVDQWRQVGNQSPLRAQPSAEEHRMIRRPALPPCPHPPSRPLRLALPDSACRRDIA